MEKVLLPVLERRRKVEDALAEALENAGCVIEHNGNKDRCLCVPVPGFGDCNADMFNLWDMAALIEARLFS